MRLLRSTRPPTDFELLKAIHAHHRRDYLNRVAAGATARVFVPIDIPAVAAELETESDTVFGRLYFHLDPMYGEARIEGQPRKSFFTIRLGDEANCVNFPHLEAILAGLWEQHDRDLRATMIATLSLAVAVGSLVIAIWG